MKFRKIIALVAFALVELKHGKLTYNCLNRYYLPLRPLSAHTRHRSSTRRAARATCPITVGKGRRCSPSTAPYMICKT
jgi:hypothetical protein